MKSKANIVVLKTESQRESRLDWFKWLLVLVLLLAGMVANHYYGEFSIWLRMTGWFIALILAGFIASTTAKGRWTVQFFRDARIELRKVIWPTRQETMQTTLVVVVMVIILALLLWGMDSILMWMVGWLTGQRS